MRTFYVYILASRSRRLYIGVTGNLTHRIAEHRSGLCESTAKYNITRLVYAEAFSDIRHALEREKYLKGWRRSRKIALISAGNPTWDDLMPEEKTAKTG